MDIVMGTVTAVLKLYQRLVQGLHRTHEHSPSRTMHRLGKTQLAITARVLH